MDPAARLSLYLHVPFCRTLCWYCGCHTTVPNDAERVDRYVALLMHAIDVVAGVLGEGRPVTTIHFGGGTPTILDPASLLALAARLRPRFHDRPGAETSVPIRSRRPDQPPLHALGPPGRHSPSHPQPRI